MKMTLTAVLAIPDVKNKSLLYYFTELLKSAYLPGLFGFLLLSQKLRAEFSYVILLMV